MSEIQNATQNQSQQPSSPINWKRLEAQMASIQEIVKETSEQMKQTDRMVKETSAQMKETDKRIEKSRKETDRRMQETDRRIKELSYQFTSQSGHIVEGLMEPAALNLFKSAGFEIKGCWKEMKSTIKLPDGTQKKMEIDLYYHDTTDAIAVEVKINCTKEKVDHFIAQMAKFKEFFPKFKDTKVYAAIAALNYERDADQYAAEQGLYVIRVSDNDVFTLDAANKENRRIFNV